MPKSKPLLLLNLQKYAANEFGADYFTTDSKILYCEVLIICNEM